jgi:hypothetical protein
MQDVQSEVPAHYPEFFDKTAYRLSGRGVRWYQLLTPI